VRRAAAHGLRPAHSAQEDASAVFGHHADDEAAALRPAQRQQPHEPRPRLALPRGRGPVERGRPARAKLRQAGEVMRTDAGHLHGKGVLRNAAEVYERSLLMPGA